MDLLSLNSEIESSLGRCDLYDVTVQKTVPRAAWKFTDAINGLEYLNGRIAFKWQAMDAWCEESQQIFEHIRDPFSRIDTVKFESRVEVILGGVKVADSSKSIMLLEPGLPVRFYVPPEDVTIDLLQPSSFETRCPYKGRARYFTARVNDGEYRDIAWTYEQPMRDASDVTRLICFFNERVDSISIDGKEILKPVTEFNEEGDGKDSIPIPMSPWSPPRPL